MKKLIDVWILFLCLIYLSDCNSKYPTVQIDCGQIEGVAVDNIFQFHGIPYVKPPVGALRWKRPQALSIPCWNGTLSTKEYGSECIQYDQVTSRPSILLKKNSKFFLTFFLIFERWK